MEIICGELIDELRKMKLHDSIPRSGDSNLQASRYTLQTPRVPEIVREDLVEQCSVSVRAVPPSFILFSLFSCL